MRTWVISSDFTVTMLTCGRMKKLIGDEYRMNSGA
jgi:hypothetical protein